MSINPEGEVHLEIPFKLKVTGEGTYKGPREVISEQIAALEQQPASADRDAQIAELRLKWAQAPEG